MFRVVLILNDFEKMLIAPDASVILRRACSLSVDTARVMHFLLQCQPLLDGDFMLPAIAEIVFMHVCPNQDPDRDASGMLLFQRHQGMCVDSLRLPGKRTL